MAVLACAIRRTGRTVLAAASFAGLFACEQARSMEAPAPESRDGATPPLRGPDAPTPAPFCARERSDAVRDAFCSDSAAEIRSLRDLQTAVRLPFASSEDAPPDTEYASDGDPYSLDLRVALLGLSTALSGELVSPLNPRMILLGRESILAFNRGVQQVELVSRDRLSATLNFYLVTFEQACNTSRSGCSPGDLYTPAIESGWTDVHVADDVDLANTPSDCRQCHQRGLQKPILLMRELQGPWTHFFAPDQEEAGEFPEPSGTDLLHDYLRAKGDEPYGGVPTSILRSTLGFALQAKIDAQQPLLFDGSVILNERWPWTSDTGYADAPVPSPTWYAAYDAFKRGELLPLPHYDPRPTDPEKQQALTSAYQQYRTGEIAPEDLPDFADIFPDDPQIRAELGFRVEPGATPAEALVQACGTCHNDVLDQSLSRARFNIDLSRMSPAEIDVAIERVRAERGTVGAMPPAGRRQLDDATLEQLVDYLERNERSEEDDALLESAARLGMAVEQPSQSSGFLVGGF